MLKIDNSSLLADAKINTEDNIIITSFQNTILKQSLEEKKDFVTLNEKVWRFIHKMYGGGPAIKLELD